MIYFDKTLIDTKGEKVDFSAVEDDVKIGSCSLDISSSEAVVSNVEFEKDKPYVVEGLVKAALNYASYKQIYMARCCQMSIEKFLIRMKFEKSDDAYISDIPTVLMGSCCQKM